MMSQPRHSLWNPHWLFVAGFLLFVLIVTARFYAVHIRWSSGELTMQPASAPAVLSTPSGH